MDKKSSYSQTDFLTHTHYEIHRFNIHSQTFWRIESDRLFLDFVNSEILSLCYCWTFINWRVKMAMSKSSYNYNRKTFEDSVS